MIPANTRVRRAKSSTWLSLNEGTTTGRTVQCEFVGLRYEVRFDCGLTRWLAAKVTEVI